MRINTNIASLQAQRQLGSITKSFQRALERLSSGKRINRAGDDAAGLAISEGLRSQVRGFGQIVRNINDAMGVLQTVDGVLDAQLQIAQRMRELSVQASTGTLSNIDRNNLDIEFQTLLEEFDRISSQANFNGLNLLDGSLSEMNIQVGNNKGETISFGVQDSRSSAVFTDTQGSGEYTGYASLSGSRPTWTQVGDLNGDGLDDTIRRTGSRIVVDINNGDGTFSRTQTITNLGMQEHNDNATLGDFNGDGALDFIVSDIAGSDSRLFLGDGTGHFTYSQNLNEGQLEVDAGDINGDGYDDLALISFTGGYAGVRLGQANGQMSSVYDFTPAGGIDFGMMSNLGLHNEVLVLGDFNGDGKKDIAVQSGAMVDIRSFEDGGFGVIAQIAVDSDIGALASGDFDGDGIDEIIFSSYNTSNVKYYKNVDGNFVEASTIYDSYLSLNTTKDVNDDGHLDLISADGVALLGNGAGAFTTDSIIGGEISFGYFNNDDFFDVIDDESRIYTQGTTEVAAAQPFEIDSQAGAQRMLEVLSNAIENIISRRASVGAMMSRLESAENVSQLTRENLSAAQSQILDADIAEETAELTKQQVLQQAAVSVLAQANLSLQMVLSLLRP